MAKQKFKIAYWVVNNKALVNRGSLIFWLDESAILGWYDQSSPSTSLLKPHARRDCHRLHRINVFSEDEWKAKKYGQARASIFSPNKMRIVIDITLSPTTMPASA
ncbi:hypothetical protein [Serratia fonticola]|uniref:hypothetical protein n=1 Tax=Serratia fonticola TaxID=47917 RepID=UPI00406BBD29